MGLCPPKSTALWGVLEITQIPVRDVVQFGVLSKRLPIRVVVYLPICDDPKKNARLRNVVSAVYFGNNPRGRHDALSWQNDG